MVAKKRFKKSEVTGRLTLPNPRDLRTQRANKDPLENGCEISESY